MGTNSFGEIFTIKFVYSSFFGDAHEVHSSVLGKNGMFAVFEVQSSKVWDVRSFFLSSFPFPFTEFPSPFCAVRISAKRANIPINITPSPFCHVISTVYFSSTPKIWIAIIYNIFTRIRTPISTA